MSQLTTKTQVSEVLKKVEKELNNLKAVTDSPFKTGGSINIMGNKTLIKGEIEIERLIKLHGVLKGTKEVYDKSAMELGVNPCPVFNIDGYSFEDIENDIKLQINIIQYDSRKKELESLANEAKEFMTKEDKYSIFLDKLSKVVE